MARTPQSQVEVVLSFTHFWVLGLNPLVPLSLLILREGRYASPVRVIRPRPDCGQRPRSHALRTRDAAKEGGQLHVVKEGRLMGRLRRLDKWPRPQCVSSMQAMRVWWSVS